MVIKQLNNDIAPDKEDPTFYLVFMLFPMSPVTFTLKSFFRWSFLTTYIIKYVYKS